MTSVTVTSLAQSIYSGSSETLNEVDDEIVVEGNGVILESDSDSTVIGKNYSVDELYLEEPLSDYCLGGYHRGYVGEALGPDDRYVLLRKLGWGGYCTVWLAHDKRHNRHVAIKIHKSSSEYSYAARKELQILRKIQSVARSSSHPGSPHIVELLDAFAHLGPHGLHVCLVFEPLNESLLSLLGQCHQGATCNLKEVGTSCVKDGLPLELVKEVTRQVLLALDFLHKECGIVHSDIKPENVMLEFPELPNKWDVVKFLHEYSLQEQKRNGDDFIKFTVSKPLPSPLFHTFTEDLDGFSKPDFAQACGKHWKDFFKVKLVDFGNACPLTNKTQGYNVQTFEYRAPEIFLQYPEWGYAADVWSTACLFSEMCTARYLFRTENNWPQASSQLELFSTTLGPASGAFLDKCILFKNYEHCVKNRQFRSISENFKEELGMERLLAQRIEQFLMPMLQWDPAERADAMTCANHPFLRNENLISIGKLKGAITKPLLTKTPLTKSFKKFLRAGSILN
ncbi:hypothetical protein ZYGR_0U00210 [Zygosaccharomyces rouxii]|uniref:non-specific serine/threonine protein kinase n=2 Tax=Zygosaccharomyces rouxii TaxID=4956 RepID=C5DY02_ZYGRC|nr:uncharacterized protein ZYRO0F09174g [Zygosaccharomyces rouxii]KAH9199422.1 kinase-like domain-containing protein [Zygosaccharomyces rouxii]GAV50165.1 hypothetical protein ZYGR_0U00210 [Zygosaccharomyces rouxii]CAR28663.1 ZYRO0F09174p [Zygosaccharomyces rouxii]